MTRPSRRDSLSLEFRRSVPFQQNFPRHFTCLRHKFRDKYWWWVREGRMPECQSAKMFLLLLRGIEPRAEKSRFLGTVGHAALIALKPWCAAETAVGRTVGRLVGGRRELAGWMAAAAGCGRRLRGWWNGRLLAPGKELWVAVEGVVESAVREFKTAVKRVLACGKGLWSTGNRLQAAYRGL